MINDTIDFDHAITQIMHGTNTDIYLQANVLNSEYMNKSFQEIENTLNALYEKTRYLEDAIAYTKEFLETKINHFNNEINSVLHEIESVADTSKVKNLAYISYNVPFVENTEVLSDRDGRKIYPLRIKDNNYLVLDYKTTDEIKFSTCDRISNLIPYKDNLEDIKKVGQIIQNKDEAYRAIYLEEQLVTNGLSETLMFYFENPVTINSLNIGVSNCEIKNLKIGLINGTEEYIETYTIDMPIKKRHCVYIQFDLVCYNYEVIKYEIPKTVMTENVWSKPAEETYNEVYTCKTKFDKVLDITRHKKRHKRHHCHWYYDHKHHGYKRHCKHHHKGELGYDSVEDDIIIEDVPTLDDDMPIEEETIIEENYTYDMYSYVFGIDSFTINVTEFLTDGYMISDPIFIGDLKENEYIRLYTSHNKFENCEISYSILDEGIEVPIALIDEKLIENEMIFGEGIETRFYRDYGSFENSEQVIMQNGSIVDISYDDALKQAIESPQDRYSITYKSDMNNYEYKPLHDTIRIKCYIRSYKKTIENIPYISSITIRKYGEESLWTNRF